MNRPEYIYKYQNLNVNSLTSLNSSELWFSNLFNLNDPFEANYEFTPELIFGHNSNFANVDDTVTRMIKNSAVCSFTKICPTDPRQFKTNTLMWSHYADQFSGICIEFKTEDLISSLNEDKRFSIVDGDVQYTDLIHTFNKPIEAFGTDVMFKKHFAWDYENEFRILVHKDPFNGDASYCAQGLHGYNPKSINNIFAGGRLTTPQLQLLNVIVNKVNPNVEVLSLSTSNKYAYGLNYFDDREDF